MESGDGGEHWKIVGREPFDEEDLLPPQDERTVKFILQSLDGRVARWHAAFQATLRDELDQLYGNRAPGPKSLGPQALTRGQGEPAGGDSISSARFGVITGLELPSKPRTPADDKKMEQTVARLDTRDVQEVVLDLAEASLPPRPHSAKCEQSHGLLDDLETRLHRKRTKNRTNSSLLTPKPRHPWIWKHKSRSTLEKLVHSWGFNAFFIVLIMLNSVLVGFEVQSNLTTVYGGEGELPWPDYIELIMICVFTAEICLRALGQKWDFLFGHENIWNIFDIVLVLSAISEEVLATMNLTFIRILRAGRLLRTVRVLRVVRFLQHLRLMVVAIFASFASLAWAFLMMNLVIYIFSVAFMVASVTHVNEHGALHPVSINAKRYFGGVGRSFVTLLAAFTGGDDWLAVYEVLDNMGYLYGWLFLFYIIFMSFGVLNVVTGFFVDNTSRIAKIDRALAIDIELQDRADDIAELKRLFAVMKNTTKLGPLTMTEFEQMCSVPSIAVQLACLRIDVHHASAVFELLDTSDDGFLTIEEFVDGCMRIRGPATEVDLMTLQIELKRLGVKWSTFMVLAEERLGALSAAVGATQPSQLPPPGSQAPSSPSKTPPPPPPFSSASSTAGHEKGGKGQATFAASSRSAPPLACRDHPGREKAEQVAAPREDDRRHGAGDGSGWRRADSKYIVM